MDPIIQVSGISKRYQIGERVGYRTLRENLMTAAQMPPRLARALLGQANGRNEPTASNEVWALRDVSFDVMRGEVLGVIGRNGAGKSTLLKILSRITEPTTGQAQLHGRVGSLLEVGTGFHPELTGRENLYLSGAILGMRRAEVARKFDEIVDFAGVQKFIDTPVKRYSSGMYMRLAFAVAAHLETEILLVDEVLAVGDVAFQRKCLEQMGVISKTGRTILFVSHNMGSIHRLCRRAMLLSQGSVEMICTAARAIQRYQESVTDAVLKTERGVSIGGARIAPLDSSSAFKRDSGMLCEAELHTDRLIENCTLNLHIDDSEGRCIFHSRTDFEGMAPSFEPGGHCIAAELPRLDLKAGVYTVWLRLVCRMQLEERIADSERLLLEVFGSGFGFGLLDIPCRWSWRPLGGRHNVWRVPAQ